MIKPTYSDPIVLEQPIQRGEKNTITEITLRKPAAGELRGLRLGDLINGDVSANIRLLPRISQPSLTEQEAGALDVADLLAVADVVAGFLQKTAGSLEA